MRPIRLLISRLFVNWIFVQNGLFKSQIWLDFIFVQKIYRHDIYTWKCHWQKVNPIQFNGIHNFSTKMYFEMLIKWDTKFYTKLIFRKLFGAYYKPWNVLLVFSVPISWNLHNSYISKYTFSINYSVPGHKINLLIQRKNNLKCIERRIFIGAMQLQQKY